MGHTMEHRNRGAKRAKLARADLGLPADEPLRCLLDVVEDHAGVPVAVKPLADEVEGACCRTAWGTLIWLHGPQWVPRMRFTLAHELGHAWLEHDASRVDTQATLRDMVTAHEVEANAFAAELLVPTAGLEQVVRDRPTLEDLVVIASYYGVSVPMLLIRLKVLKLAAEDRLARLQAEVDEGLHHAATARLEHLHVVDDRLARLIAQDGLPYLSPALHDTPLRAALLSPPALR